MFLLIFLCDFWFFIFSQFFFINKNFTKKKLNLSLIKTKSVWKKLNENPKYEITRDERVKSFREMKELQTKYKLLETLDDDKSKREILVTLIQINISKAITQLKLITNEFEILDYKDKLENDKKTKEDYEKLLSEPKPKFKYHHIPVHFYLYLLFIL